MDVLRQFGPMIFIVLMTLILNLMTSSGPVGGASYQYSMGQNF